MWDEAFIVLVFVLFLFLIKWAFSALPKEGWQIMASVPVIRKESGEWEGLNLTYYGVFVAGACVLAVTVFLFLMASVGCPVENSLLVVMIILGLCLPASSVLARIVEKKRHTLTVGGASFLGILMAPWIAWGVNTALSPAGNGSAIMFPALSAMCIAYAFGEGIGRLACISFGCCYGRPLNQCPGWVRKLVGRKGFVFSGATKKISYESGLDGQQVIPIQGITSVLYVCIGLIAMLLYLKGHFGAAFALSMIVTQAWRAFSETLRADYRGNGSISAYQIMALGAVVYAVLLMLVLPPAAAGPAHLGTGLHALWDPMVLTFLEILGIGVFLFSGRSRVTASTLSFHVMGDRI
jgi:hypothetical protein